MESAPRGDDDTPSASPMAAATTLCAGAAALRPPSRAVQSRKLAEPSRPPLSGATHRTVEVSEKVAGVAPTHPSRAKTQAVARPGAKLRPQTAMATPPAAAPAAGTTLATSDALVVSKNENSKRSFERREPGVEEV